jgi:glycosyltransferase involved in cell wall biosynthesis
LSHKKTKDKKPLSVSVVVPVYNSASTLMEHTSRTLEVLSSHAHSYEIIYVNDCSKDDSWNVIKRLTRINSNVIGLNLMHNYGQHNALLAGIQRARYDIIITLDDDLQHPPEEIPRLLEKLEEGYDVVYGKPAERQHRGWRNIGSYVLKSSLKVILGAEMGKSSSAFRCFRSILRRGFANFTDAQLSIDVLLSWSAARVTSIPVRHEMRKDGRSGYTLKKLLTLTFNMITGYSSLPLRIASTLGLLSSIVGILLFIRILIMRFMQTNNVPGFAFIAAEIALFAGLQLFAIGVIGEYIAKLHFRTMGKPAYTIREEARNPGLSDLSEGGEDLEDEDIEEKPKRASR